MRVLVTGAAGQLGTELVTAFAPHDVVGLTHADGDIGDRDFVLGALTTLRPDLVIHAAAWTAVDACEADPDRAWAVNVLGTRHVAEGSWLSQAHLCVVSTDYVFDGSGARPYVEWDPTSPLNVYGRSKLGAEQEALRVPGTCVVRTSWLCGAAGANFVATMLRQARDETRTEVPVVSDQIGCPTFAPDLAGAIRHLAVARLPGLFHVTNQGALSWYEFARAIFDAAGADPERVRPIATSELSPTRAAARPRYSVLDNAALRASGLPLLGEFHDPLRRLVRELS